MLAKQVAAVLTLFLVAVLVVVAFTVLTSYTEDQVRRWFEAVGGPLSAATAVVVALIGFRAQRLQALEAAKSQREAAHEAAERSHEAERQRFERQAALEREREKRSAENEAKRQALMREMSRYMERRSLYADLLQWADDQAAGEHIDRSPIYGQVLAGASSEVGNAVIAFVKAEPDERAQAFAHLVELVRGELRADEPIVSGPAAPPSEVID